MPPRSATSASLLQPVVDEFARRLGATLERFITARIENELKTRGRASQKAKRPAPRCYFPGCKNVAAPRFSMFCAKLHKDLPQREKDKYRAQRANGAAGAPRGSQKRAARKKAKGKRDAQSSSA
jgi:hypothetical protein